MFMSNQLLLNTQVSSDLTKYLQAKAVKWETHKSLGHYKHFHRQFLIVSDLKPYSLNIIISVGLTWVHQAGQ